MPEYNLLKSYPKGKRDIKARSKGKTDEIVNISKQFGEMYFDGPREYGYGGYKYDGRWIPVAKEIVSRYNLKKGDKVLDIGCAKGFLIKDLLSIGIDAYGIDISEYALKNCELEVIGRLHYGTADKLPFPDKSFSATISINVIHNLPRSKCITALREMERLAPGKGYVQVDSYRTPEEKIFFLSWMLTGATHYYPEEWKKLFKEANYSGDYYWTLL